MRNSTRNSMSSGRGVTLGTYQVRLETHRVLGDKALGNCVGCFLPGAKTSAVDLWGQCTCN